MPRKEKWTSRLTLEWKELSSVRPAPEHDQLFMRVDPSDPTVTDLAISMRSVGTLEPLRVSKDGYILSGYRRRLAAELAGWKRVPCWVEPYSRTINPRHFIRRLCEHKRPHEHVCRDLVEQVINAASPSQPDDQQRRRRKHDRCVGRPKSRNPRARRECGCTRCDYRGFHLTGELLRAAGVHCPRCGANVVEVKFLD